LTAPPPTRRTPVWQVLLGTAISGGLLYLSLREVKFSQLIGYVRGARVGLIILAVALATLTFALRIFRWQLLLRGDDGRRLTAGPLWHAIAMGFMANNVLPLRIGEVVRTYAAARLTRTRFTPVLASIAVERLFDAVTVVILLGIGLFTARLPASEVSGRVNNIVTFGGGAALFGLVLAALVVTFPGVAERIVQRLVPSARLSAKIVGIIEGVSHGFSALKSPARVAGVLFWSFGVWCVSALSFYLMYLAFNIPVDFAGALLMQGLIMFGIALPSTPGYVGVFEYPITTVLGLYGADPNLAAAYALTYHVTTFLPITLLGAYSIFRTNLGLMAFRQEAA
jgi:uncharacterized protein (TIRG00374 family)